MKPSAKPHRTSMCPCVRGGPKASTPRSRHHSTGPTCHRAPTQGHPWWGPNRSSHSGDVLQPVASSDDLRPTSQHLRCVPGPSWSPAAACLPSRLVPPCNQASAGCGQPAKRRGPSSCCVSSCSHIKHGSGASPSNEMRTDASDLSIVPDSGRGTPHRTAARFGKQTLPPVGVNGHRRRTAQVGRCLTNRPWTGRSTWGWSGVESSRRPGSVSRMLKTNR